MKRTQLAIGIVAVALTLAAEPVCQRLVFRAAHRHHSKATLASWAEWNKTHVPLKPKEIIAELDLACPPLDVAAIDTGDFIPAEVVPTWEPDEVVLVDELHDLPYDYLVPTGLVEGAPLLLASSIAAQPVPEPWPIGLVMFGASCLYMKTFGKDEAK
jgi:hypothetical protein